MSTMSTIADTDLINHVNHVNHVNHARNVQTRGFDDFACFDGVFVIGHLFGLLEIMGVIRTFHVYFG